MNKNLYTKESIEIIDFYLFNCPIILNNRNKVSYKAKTLTDMGIYGGKLTELLTSIMDLGLKIDYQNRRDLKKLIKKYNNKKNYIIYTNLSRLGKTKSLLYSIRNALAHGNFEFKNNFLYGENFYNKNLKGKFVISNKILLNIITIIHNNKVKNKMQI